MNDQQSPVDYDTVTADLSRRGARRIIWDHIEDEFVGEEMEYAEFRGYLEAETGFRRYKDYIKIYKEGQDRDDLNCCGIG